MKQLTMQPINGLGESACEEILEKMEESGGEWLDQLKNKIHKNPWPWAIGAGVVLLMITGGRRRN